MKFVFPFLSVLCLWSVAVLAEGPSFDCRLAKSRTEKAICAEVELRELDLRLGRFFQAARSAGRDGDRRSLLQEQRTWLKQRDTCGASHRCLAQVMRRRIAQLEPLALLSEARPSFDCRRAILPAEKMICERAELGWLDRVLAQRYRQIYDRLAVEERRGLRRDQRAWLDLRNGCGADHACLARAMLLRAGELDLLHGRDLGRPCPLIGVGPWCGFQEPPVLGNLVLTLGDLALDLTTPAEHGTDCRQAAGAVRQDWRAIGRLDGAHVETLTGRRVGRRVGDTVIRVRDGRPVCRQLEGRVIATGTSRRLGQGDLAALCLCSGLLH